jgi:hypothetical protein
MRPNFTDEQIKALIELWNLEEKEGLTKKELGEIANYIPEDAFEKEEVEPTKEEQEIISVCIEAMMKTLKEYGVSPIESLMFSLDFEKHLKKAYDKYVSSKKEN